MSLPNLREKWTNRGGGERGIGMERVRRRMIGMRKGIIVEEKVRA